MSKFSTPENDPPKMAGHSATHPMTQAIEHPATPPEGTAAPAPPVASAPSTEVKPIGVIFCQGGGMQLISGGGLNTAAAGVRASNSIGYFLPNLGGFYGQVMLAMGENNMVDIKNKSYAVTANLILPETEAKGVIIAQGANFGGWAIYAHNGKLKYIYNFLGLDLYEVEASEPLPSGEHQVRLEFAYDGGGAGKGGTATLYLDGEQIAEGRVDHTHAGIFSADSTALVGNKFGAPIGPDLKIEGNPFNGTVKGVQIDLNKTDADHYVSDAERWRIAMAIQ